MMTLVEIADAIKHDTRVVYTARDGRTRMEGVLLSYTLGQNKTVVRFSFDKLGSPIAVLEDQDLERLCVLEAVVKDADGIIADLKAKLEKQTADQLTTQRHLQRIKYLEYLLQEIHGFAGRGAPTSKDDQ